jgi:two-component system sensor histidine kinase BaeS
MIDSVVLEDANRQHVAGESVAKADILIEQSITSNGTVVGWLKLPGPTRMGADARFLEEVLKTSWIVAGLALLLAAIVALPLARRFISPIRRLAGATQRLSSGDFTGRVEIASDDELGQLTRDFNGLVATLAQAEEARRGFIADVSHELRTPLAILKGEVDALRDGITSPTPEAIESLRVEVTTLERLVHELYDLAVSDLGRAVYNFEDVDLASLAGDAADTYRDRMAARGLTLDSSGIPSKPLVAKTEARRIMQLFNNLLENSLRYTDSGGRVEMRLREEGGEAVIDVMDTAPGVPEALRPRLFERLFRVEPSRSREFGGAGLGLALCRSIARAHGGNVAAKESPLGGLWIEIRLPLSGPPATP